MNLRQGAAGLSSRFAHLAGITRKPVAAEGDPPAEPDNTDDEEAKKAAEEAKKAAEEAEESAEDAEDSAEDAEESAEDAEDAADDATTPKPPLEAKAYRAGARAERTRCGAIFASHHAAANPVLAAHLAFETSMSVRQATALMKASAAGVPARVAGGGLAALMAGTKPIAVGSGGGGPNMDTPEGVAAHIIAARNRARGIKKEG